MVMPYSLFDDLFQAISPRVLFTLGMIVVGILAIYVIFALAFYLFQAFALFTISKRRGYRYPWLAFLPVANQYLLGAVADNINYCGGKKTRLRYLLTGLSVGSAVLTLIGQLCSGNLLYLVYALTGQAPLPAGFALSVVASLFGWLVGLTLTAAGFVAVYRIFFDYDEPHAVIYLILSVVFRITPFLLFAIRNRPSSSLTAAVARQTPEQEEAPVPDEVE